MGLRFRTPIGSLREQRRKAEGQLPHQAGRATTLRYRNKESLGDSMATENEFGKRVSLIERLRTVLASDRSQAGASLSECQVLQDELARISHHQQVNRNDGSKTLVDLNVPRNMFFDSAAPFRYVIFDGGKKTIEFEQPIQKLQSAPTNLDAYVSNITPFDEQIPRSMPLTLLLSSDAETIVVKPNTDPAHEAAQLTQSNVTHSTNPKERSFISKSLVLSLLDDN